MIIERAIKENVRISSICAPTPTNIIPKQTSQINQRYLITF